MIGKNINREIFTNVSDKVRQYFSKQSVGIDISDRTIEVVEIKKEKSTMTASSNRIFLEPGIVEKGRIVKRDLLKEKVRKVLESAQPSAISAKEAIFALPESQVFTHVFHVGIGNQEELETAVAKEVEFAIPLPFDDVVYSFQVLGNESPKLMAGGEGREVLVIAVSKQAVEEWHGFFQSLGLTANFFEIEPTANLSGLISGKSGDPVCMADLGSNTTSVFILSKDCLYYSYSLPIGGDVLTEAVITECASRKRDISWADAEKLKIRQDFKKDNKYSAIFKKILDPLVSEIAAAVRIGEERTGKIISEAYLIGGTSMLKGLPSYLAERLRAMEPQKKTALDLCLGQIRSINGSQLSIVYAEALGLAWRGMNSDSRLKVLIPPGISGKRRILKDGWQKNNPEKAKNADSGNISVVESLVLKAKKRLFWLLVLIIVGILAVIVSFWRR